MTVWSLETKEHGVSTMDDAAKTVHRDVILMADSSPEGQAIAAALRMQGFAVSTSTVEGLAASVQEESPRVLIVDIDQPGAREAIVRVRQLQGGAGAELVCLGDPTLAAAVGATTAAGRAFARPVDMHAIMAQIGALADPAPIDEELFDDAVRDTSPRRPGESVPPVFVEDGSGAFSAVFQSVFPSGPDPMEMGTSIFPPEDGEGQSPTAMLVTHPMQLSPELTELLATAEQRILAETAFVSMPPAPQVDEESDVVLGDDYLSLLEDPIENDEEAPGTGPELGQTGAIDLSTGPQLIAALSLSSTQASPSAPTVVPDTVPPMTTPNAPSAGGSPPVDTTPPLPRGVLPHVAVREPIKVRDVIPDKLPISYTDEVSGSPNIPRHPTIAIDSRGMLTGVSTESPVRRIEPSPAISAVKRPIPPVVIDSTIDAQPPTVLPGRMSSAMARIDVGPATSSQSPTTQQSMRSMSAPSTINPSTINPPTINPSTINPSTINPSTNLPSTSKPKSPPASAPVTSRPPGSPPATSKPQASPQTAPTSAAPSSPRPTKPTPLPPPPNVVRRSASDPPPSVRMVPPIPPPPAPLPNLGAGVESSVAPSSGGDKPVVLGPGEVPRALARAIANRVTGSLALHSDGLVRRIVLHEGDVVTAGSSVADESLLSFLVLRGDIERDVAARLAGRLPPAGRHAGAALIAHGYLGQDALWRVLRAHVEWLMGAFVLVESGTLEHEPDPPGRLRAEPSVFGGSTGAEVFVDAVRRVVPPEVAQSRLGGLAARFDNGPRTSLLSEVPLRPDELALVQAAAGMTVGELVDRGGAELSSLLYALVCLEVLGVLAPSRRMEKARPETYDPLDQEAIRMRVRARMALVEEGDYFAVLGVPHGATSYEIRRAFLDLRRSFEPSKLLTAETADLARDVRTVLEVLDEAYEILKDNHRRERYRRAIEAGPVG